MKLLKIPTYIYCLIINIIALFSMRIPKRARFILMNLAIVCLNALGIIGHVNEELKSALNYYDYVNSISTISLIVLMIVSIDRKVRIRNTEQVNLLFWYGWYICFIAIFAGSFAHPTRDIYLLWSILSLTVFPIIIITWKDRGELGKWFNLVANHMVLASYIFLLINIVSVAFITNPYIAEGVRHEFLGITPNPNSNGLIVLPYFAASLYLLITSRKNRAYHILSLCICIMFAYISNTRTAEFAIIIEVIISLLLVWKYRDFYKWNWSIKQTSVTILIAVAITIVIGGVLMHIDKVDLKAYAASDEEMIEATSEVYANDTLIAINKLTSGRLILWKAYIKKVGLGGHGNPNEPVFEGFPESKWAHNNAIDIWYASGFIAFAGYIMWLLSAWGFIIKSIVTKNDYRKEYLLTAIAFVGYFTEAMLEITIYPMETGVVLLSFLTLTPIAFTNDKSERLANDDISEHDLH